MNENSAMDREVFARAQIPEGTKDMVEGWVWCEDFSFRILSNVLNFSQMASQIKAHIFHAEIDFHSILYGEGASCSSLVK